MRPAPQQGALRPVLHPETRLGRPRGYNLPTAVTKMLLRYLLKVTHPRRTGLEWWDLIEIALVAAGFLAYFLVRGAVIDREADAFSHARSIIDLQDMMGIWIEPEFNAWVVDHRVVTRFLNFVYFWLDFPLVVGVGLLLFWRRRNCYTLLRDSILISGAFALVFYWTFPVAPPRYLTDWGFVDTVEQFSNLSYQAQSMRPFVNPYAAVPSLHVGWAMLLVVAVFQATPHWGPRSAMFAIFVAQSVAVVGTANHFILDGVAGLIVCAAALAVGLLLQRYGYPGVRSLIASLERIADGTSKSERVASDG